MTFKEKLEEHEGKLIRRMNELDESGTEAEWEDTREELADVQVILSAIHDDREATAEGDTRYYREPGAKDQ